MTAEQLGALAVLAVAMALFVARVRVDLVALLVVLALALSGLCTTQAALAGFGSTVVVMIASLLVVGEGLARTGVAEVVGGWIGRLGGEREDRTRAAVILSSGVLGSFMNSTAVVALFLPVVLRVAHEHRIAPNRLLLPLAYGSLISGMMTLIGTAPNLIVHAELRARGHAGLGFFDFTPVGSAVLLAAVLCFWVGARRLLPPPPPSGAGSRRPRIRDLWREFVPDEDLVRLAVGAGAGLVGKSLRESELGLRFGLRVLAIQRREASLLNRNAHEQPTAGSRFRAGDVLVVAGRAADVDAAVAEHGLRRAPMTARDLARLDRDIGAAVVMVHPDSELVGKSLVQAGFRERHDLHVAGARRDGAPLGELSQVPLRAADTLFVLGGWRRIAGLQSETRDFVALALPAELATAAPERGRMPVALAIVTAMVALSATGALPVVTSALAAAVALVLTRCVPMAEAYRSIHWGSLVLIAGMLPLAEVLGRTGVLRLAVEGLVAAVGDAGPRVVLAVVFLATAGVGSIVSNSATAVLMAPIAIGLAEALHLAPQAFAMTVALAASSAYLTPMASPVMTLVVEPGGYRFGDFLRAGLPLSVATLALTVWLVPLVLPL